MKRDLDFIRDLLLRIESGSCEFDVLTPDVAAALGLDPDLGTVSRSEADKLSGHLRLLEDAGFIEMGPQGGGGPIVVDRLTWAGHDFLDSVRDPEIWVKARDGAAAAGSWTFDIVKALATAFAKAKLKELTGVDL